MSVARDDDDFTFDELPAAGRQSRNSERRMEAAHVLADLERGSSNPGVAAARSVRHRPGAGVSAGTDAGFLDQASVQASNAPEADLAPRSAGRATDRGTGRGRGRGRGGPGRGNISRSRVRSKVVP